MTYKELKMATKVTSTINRNQKVLLSGGGEQVLIEPAAFWDIFPNGGQLKSADNREVTFEKKGGRMHFRTAKGAFFFAVNVKIELQQALAEKSKVAS